MIVRRLHAATITALLVFAACGSDSAAPAGPSNATGETPPSGTDGSEAAPASDGGPDATAPASVVGRLPEGFSTITARITDADGNECEVCVWLADTSEERARGLMGVTDLGDATGMAFRFEESSAGSFYMFQTPSPLSIAWFGSAGEHVGSADMTPCLDTSAGQCPLYSPGADYQLALEVFAGGLEALGIGPGSRLELLAGTEAERCPVSPP